MSNDTIEINEYGQPTDIDASLEELSDRAEAEDFLVKCNTCGWRRPRSVSEQCPSGHTSGFSYAGPLEEAEPEVGDDGFTAEENANGEAMDAAVDEAMVEEQPEAVEQVEVDESGVVVNEAYEKRPTGAEWAMKQIIEQNRRVILQNNLVNSMNAELNGERQTLKEMQKDLNNLISEAEKVEKANEPDPKRYPLYDRPKEPTAKDAINAQFAKPEAIQPLPADTPEEFYRRKKRDARFADMGLKPKIVEILEGAGYCTVLDLERLHEAQADITTIRCHAGTITEKRGEEIRDALGEVATRWVEEWQAAHPEADEANVPEVSPEPPSGTDPAPPDSPDGDPPIGDPSTPIGPDVPAMEAE